MQRAAWHAVTDDLASVADAKARAIKHEVNQLSNKVSKMLAWARLDIAGLKHEPIDLAEIAVAAAAQLRPLGNERGIVIELRTRGEASPPGMVAWSRKPSAT